MGKGLGLGFDKSISTLWECGVCDLGERLLKRGAGEGLNRAYSLLRVSFGASLDEDLGFGDFSTLFFLDFLNFFGCFSLEIDAFEEVPLSRVSINLERSLVFLRYFFLKLLNITFLFKFYLSFSSIFYIL